MNIITPNMTTGTAGELLVQLRLLEYGVQAAAPIKDSGNDLVAIRGRACRAVQVKTTTRRVFSMRKLPEIYDILAVVQLVHHEAGRLLLDQSRVFLVPVECVPGISTRVDSLGEFEMSGERIDKLFSDQQ